MENENDQPLNSPEPNNQPLVFRANLSDRQSSLMMSGRGDRLLIELEAFGLDAVLALVGLTKFTGKSFQITIEELPNSWTKLDKTGILNRETPDQSATRAVITVGRGGTGKRGDQQTGE